nr:hypothetical protein [uncultured bacterium]
MMQPAKGSIKTRPAQPRGETRSALHSQSAVVARRRRREFPPCCASGVTRHQMALFHAKNRV